MVIAKVWTRPGVGEPEATDEELCSRLAKRDQQALARLYDRHGQAVFGAALRITGSRGAAADVVEVGFLQLWQAPDRYSSARGSFPRWFMRQIINLAMDQVRSDRPPLRLDLAPHRAIRLVEPAAGGWAGAPPA